MIGAKTLMIKEMRNFYNTVMLITGSISILVRIYAMIDATCN